MHIFLIVGKKSLKSLTWVNFHPRRRNKDWIYPPKWNNQRNTQNIQNAVFPYSECQATKGSDANVTGPTEGELYNRPNLLPWEIFQGVKILSKRHCYKNKKISNRHGENIWKSNNRLVSKANKEFSKLNKKTTQFLKMCKILEQLFPPFTKEDI